MKYYPFFHFFLPLDCFCVTMVKELVIWFVVSLILLGFVIQTESCGSAKVTASVRVKV